MTSRSSRPAAPAADRRGGVQAVLAAATDSRARASRAAISAASASLARVRPRPDLAQGRSKQLLANAQQIAKALHRCDASSASRAASRVFQCVGQLPARGWAERSCPTGTGGKPCPDTPPTCAADAVEPTPAHFSGRAALSDCGKTLWRVHREDPKARLRQGSDALTLQDFKTCAGSSACLVSASCQITPTNTDDRCLDAVARMACPLEFDHP